MNLPEAFEARMKIQLGEEYPAFLSSFEEDRYAGLRINTLKCPVERFAQLNDLQEKRMQLTPVPWCDKGFYYRQEDRPGRRVWHEAGLYYIQEPSAMSAAVLLDAQPGERVLDLCAAPGGKTGQLAAAMEGKGLLVANEIHPARAKILSQNMERLGVRNALVVNHSPESLSEHWSECFDRILCDAPCSGEGMFRKDENAISEWSPEHVWMCAERQLYEVLLPAVRMLKPGGRLVYSTCTFSEDENENVIIRLLELCPDMETDPSVKAPWFSNGKIPGTYRLWPHKLHGEGHGVAVLRKKNDNMKEGTVYDFNDKEYTLSFRDKKMKDYKTALMDLLKTIPESGYSLFGGQLYCLPEGCPSLKGIKVLRPGLKIGELKGKNFKPDHALAMALDPAEAAKSMELTHEQAESYLRGETIAASSGKGWTLVQVDGVSLGWGKISNGMLKNHYPKGLRINWQS